MAKRVAATFVPPIALDRLYSVPFHRQIFDWFQQAIVEGRIHPGVRVPSTRGLATELGVSRIPVVNAYEQLHAEGYFETSKGIGTRIARSIPHGDPAPGGRHKQKASRNMVATGPGVRSISRRGRSWSYDAERPWLNTLSAFRVSLPALEHFPVNVWAKLVSRHTRGVSRNALAYGDAKGYWPLREGIAEYVRTARGVRCETSQVVVTAGSQQALQIVSQVLLNRGDRVCIEEPGYGGARQAFAMADARIIPIGLDQEGIRLSELLRRGKGARVLYVTPSHQYPMGMTMSASRRMQLLTWAERNRTWIIEDDYDSEYRFDSRPVGALQGLDGDQRVLYMGTFSKVMFPSLRLAYLVLPKDLIPACTAARDAMDIFSPTVNQAAMADFIREGHFARHLRRMRVLYMERRRQLCDALREVFGDTIEVTGSAAGMHLVILFRSKASDLDVSFEAAKAALSVMPLSSCCMDARKSNGLVLGYGGVSGKAIHDGVRTLRRCLERVMQSKRL